MRMGNRRHLVRLYWSRLRAEGPTRSAARIVSSPSRIVRHLRRLISGDAGALSNWYAPSASIAADIQFVARALRVEPAEVERAFAELDGDDAFMSDVRARYASVRSDQGDRFDPGRFRTLYAFVRLGAPRTAIETGVHDGLSSALILRAMERNGKGALVSIDLPSPDLPPGTDGPGWLVAEELRRRWTLVIGDSRVELGRIARERAPVDLFLHDSDHSRRHREFEFRTVREYLAPNGVLLSDDDDAPDTLLDELAQEWSMVHGRCGPVGHHGPCIGALTSPPGGGEPGEGP
ncbi:MAG: class I SAM-dependent methyltransferase [Chloroflexi bacterium]|nr:class I SAM-dependent methyltransferase [Chloroflexota bacterium]